MSSDFARGLEVFSLRLHNNITQAQPPGNVICSPLSIRTAAGMLRMGAMEGSATAKELDEGLRFGGFNTAKIADSFGGMIKAYEQCDILKMVNRLYFMKDYKIGVDFDRIMEKKFNSKPVELDFRNAEAHVTINFWVESETNNKIKNLIAPGVLGPDTRMVLVNAIHFKGEWSSRFDERNTIEEDFFETPERVVFVTMMHQTAKFPFAKLPILKATALKMDYNACGMFMLLILPDKDSTLESLESNLSKISLKTLTDIMRVRKVDVKIPKFKAELGQELSTVFKQMGMTRIFGDQAEFGPMLKSPTPIWVSQIIHKAFIDVNELGTEAGAATAVVVMTRTMPAPEIIEEFHAKRPFFYAICDSTHGFLFVGHFASTESVEPEICECGLGKRGSKKDRCTKCYHVEDASQCHS